LFSRKLEEIQFEQSMKPELLVDPLLGGGAVMKTFRIISSGTKGKAKKLETFDKKRDKISYNLK